MSKIEFKSKIKQNGKDNLVKFDSEVQISKWKKFKVYEFLEPVQKIQNRIEISENKVNIFSGPATINLELNKEIIIEYTTEVGFLFMSAYMNKLENKVEGEITIHKFMYTLTQGETEVGSYELYLKIKE
ncbi:MAG: DUF1934 family protein [Mollicutes bacterium PWAP]|nr:DUF1934 family protein [Mollicutes bacterium PWAP]